MATALDLSQPTPDRTDEELETILTSFDTSYVWNYGSVKEGLRDLYEKAKREQWNGTHAARLGHAGRPRGARSSPPQFNPLTDYAPFKKLDERERRASCATRRSRSSSRSSCTASRAR